MSNGYIKIDRGLLNNWLWQEKPFSKGQAWVDLLLLATWKENKELYRGQLVRRQPGEISCSMLWLADRWGWHRETVKKYLDLLRSDGMVSYAPTTQGTTVTIENWAKYQGGATTEPTTEPTTMWQRCGNGTDNDVAHHKKVKEREEGSKKVEEYAGEDFDGRLDAMRERIMQVRKEYDNGRQGNTDH